MTFSELVNVDYVSDLLRLGGLGFVGGVLLPFGARLIGYVVDVVWKFVR